MTERSPDFKSLARRIARIERNQSNMSKPQLAYSSIENGNLKSYEGNDLKMIVGLQDDGGQSTTVFNGPTPPTPIGFTVDVDHGKFILHWQGGFDADALAPSDWSRAEVHASPDPFFVPSRTTARGSIVSAAGGEITIGVLKGPWTIKMLAWSQAGKMSVPSAPVDVEVPGYGDIVLAEIDAAETRIENAREVLLDGQNTLGGKLDSAFGSIDTINGDLSDLDAAVQGAITSANGKNTVHFDDHAPAPEVEGVEGDTWFAGQVGRPNDVIEATNLIPNPSLEGGITGWRARDTFQATVSLSTFGPAIAVGTRAMYIQATDNASTNCVAASNQIPVNPNSMYTFAASVRKSSGTGAISLRVYWYDSSGNRISVDHSAVYRHVPGTAQNDLVATRVSGQYPSPSGAVSAEVGFWLTGIVGDPTPGTTVHIDAATFVESSEDAPYFDGDTPSGTTDNDPHYRWTGTPHASTSEKYLPALAIGESDNWNVTEQYRHDGTGWKRVELSHEVLSTVDVGKLVAGSAAIKEAVVQKLFAEVVVSRMSVADEFIGENAILTGAVTAPKITASEELWAKLAQFVTVYAEMVDSDVFNGRVFRGSTFLTTNDSRWSDAGLFLNDVDGNPRIQAPTDGSDFTVNAEVVAKSLTATGRASFLAENNRLEPGAGLVLAAGVGDPPSPPVVSTYYPTIKAPLEDTDRGAYGLAWADGHFWRWVENENPTGNRGRLEKITTDGEIAASFDTGDFLARNGAVGIGSELFLLGPKTGSNDRRWVRVYGVDGAFKREWQYTFHVASTKYQPGIGRDDEGNIVIAHCWSDTGKLTWRTFNKTTGALMSTFDSPDETKSDINGVYVGTGDFGARRAVIAKVSGVGSFRQFPAFTTTSGDYVVNDSWYSPGQGEPLGITWDGEKFHTISQSGTISEFSTPSTGDSGGANWWAAYRWAKDVDEDLTIDLSSRISPPARFSWPRRARLLITAPNLPQAAGEIAPSLAYKSTTPTRTDFHSPTWWSVTGEPSAYYYTLPADWASASTPTDGNNFPDGEPSELAAASGLFSVKGDGSGHWGPLVFNPDGTMSSTAVPAWIPITSFASGFSAQTWGYVPAYRIWPDGKVEWRGTIQGTMDDTKSMLTVPVAARPSQAVNLTVVTNTSVNTCRVEFSSNDRPTGLAVYPVGTTRTWLSLDGIFYYLN